MVCGATGAGAVPVTFVAVLGSTFIITLIWATGRGDVYTPLPYISDAGALAPQVGRVERYATRLLPRLVLVLCCSVVHVVLRLAHAALCCAPV